MARAFPASILAAFGLALASCAPGAVIDRVPSEVGGLPADAPARPATAYQYPAVHDMPAPRSTTPLSEEEQVKLEKDLAAVREQQAREVAEDPDKTAAPPPKTQAPKSAAAAPAAKKKPAQTGVVPPASAKANP